MIRFLLMTVAYGVGLLAFGWAFLFGMVALGA